MDTTETRSLPPVTRDFTATTFVVHEGRTLLLHHRKLDAWFPPGGHIDPHELPDAAAVREVLEESGLEVELVPAGGAHLAGLPTDYAGVRVLPQPYCILLEDITPGHQHIDLIYFARVSGGSLLHSEREAQGARWLTWDELAAPEIHEDIRELGRRAIELCR
jgi:ADP-ribose pyrophosphatase YjhB (NUDIX family)